MFVSALAMETKLNKSLANKHVYRRKWLDLFTVSTYWVTIHSRVSSTGGSEGWEASPKQFAFFSPPKDSYQVQDHSIHSEYQ